MEEGGNPSFRFKVYNAFVEYSQTPHNPYPSVDSQCYGLWGVMGYESQLLVWNDDLVAQKLWVIKSMG